MANTQTPTFRQVTSTSLTGIKQVVTELPHGGSSVHMQFPLFSEYTEAQALNAAEDSFILEDAGVSVHRANDQSDWTAEANYVFQGDVDAAVKFAEKAFRGTPAFRALMDFYSNN